MPNAGLKVPGVAAAEGGGIITRLVREFLKRLSPRTWEDNETYPSRRQRFWLLSSPW